MCPASYVSFATLDSSMRTFASPRCSSSHCVVTYADTSASGRICAPDLSRDVAQFAGEMIVEPHERAIAFREQSPVVVPYFRTQLDQPAAVARHPCLDAQRCTEPTGAAKRHVD